MELIKALEMINENLDYDQKEAFRNGGAVNSKGKFAYKYVDLGTGNSYKANGRIIGESVVIREYKYDTHCGQEETNKESLIINNIKGENYQFYIERLVGSALKKEREEDVKIIDKLYDRCEEIMEDISKGATYEELQQKYKVSISVREAEIKANKIK